MSTTSREVIWGGRIMGADIHAKGAREAAQKAIREADRAETEGKVSPDGGYGGPAPNRLQRAPNASTADWAGSRWSVIAARREQAFRSMLSAARGTRRSGSLRMPGVQEGTISAAGADDQANGCTGDHAVQMSSSG